MRLAFGVEGHTWGPRVRARAVVSRIGGTVVGVGEPPPPLEGLDYRRVRWTDPHPLAGFDVVVGDPSCVAMREPGALGISIRIAGQNDLPRYGAGRPVDGEWDAETFPLHPWATGVLPNRGWAREWLEAGLPRTRPPGRPVLVVLDQSSTPGVLEHVVRSHARGWDVVALKGWGAHDWIIGADFLVCSAGWSQVVQARACGIPFVAVEQNSNDQWVRAHCTIGELPTVVANLTPRHSDLDPRTVPHVEDHLPAFVEFVKSHSRLEREGSFT